MPVRRTKAHRWGSRVIKILYNRDIQSQINYDVMAGAPPPSSPQLLFTLVRWQNPNNFFIFNCYIFSTFIYLFFVKSTSFMSAGSLIKRKLINDCTVSLVFLRILRGLYWIIYLYTFVKFLISIMAFPRSLERQYRSTLFPGSARFF